MPDRYKKILMWALYAALMLAAALLQTVVFGACAILAQSSVCCPWRWRACVCTQSLSPRGCSGF